MLIPVVALATLLSLIVSSIAGRSAGLTVTAACSACLAFFLMPPIFSFRVAQIQDIVALSFYGAAGLVVAGAAPSKRKTADPQREPARELGKRQRIESEVSSAVADFIASRSASETWRVAINVADGVTVPCTRAEILPVLVDVFIAAERIPNVQRIFIYGGRRPGSTELTIMANYVWPLPDFEAIVIGKG